MQQDLFNQDKKQEDPKTREAALAAIKKILDAGNVDEQFANRSGSYHSKDKFLVSWIGKYKTMPVEFSIDKTDYFYAAYSGYHATYNRRNLIYEKQIKGFASIEQALIIVGIKLCKNLEEKQQFFNKYAVPYNDRVKSQNNKA